MKPSLPNTMIWYNLDVLLQMCIWPFVIRKKVRRFFFANLCSLYKYVHWPKILNFMLKMSDSLLLLENQPNKRKLKKWCIDRMRARSFRFQQVIILNWLINVKAYGLENDCLDGNTEKLKGLWIMIPTFKKQNAQK